MENKLEENLKRLKSFNIFSVIYDKPCRAREVVEKTGYRGKDVAALLCRLRKNSRGRVFVKDKVWYAEKHPLGKTQAYKDYMQPEGLYTFTDQHKSSPKAVPSGGELTIHIHIYIHLEEKKDEKNSD